MTKQPKWQVYMPDENGNEKPFGKPWDKFEDAEKFMEFADATTIKKVCHD